MIDTFKRPYGRGLNTQYPIPFLLLRHERLGEHTHFDILAACCHGLRDGPFSKGQCYEIKQRDGACCNQMAMRLAHVTG